MDETQKLFTEFKLEEVEGKKVFVASDDTVDREGEVLAVDGWELDNFKRNPVMLWSHNPYDLNIGKWENVRYRTVGGRKKLTMEPSFHKITEISRALSEMVDKGYMSTVSVGFRPKEKQGNVFTKQELLEVSFVNIPANPEATTLAFSKNYSPDTVKFLFGEDLAKGVIGYKETPKADKGQGWDGPEQIASASIDDLKAMCAWFNSDAPDLKSSYKLPHHEAGGSHTVIWKGVVAAMAALLGARGGVKIPEGDRAGVYTHLAKHYAQFDETPPPLKSYEESELKSMFPELFPITQADLGPLQTEIKNLGTGLSSLANPVPKPGSSQVKGRSAIQDRKKKLLLIADKALGELLRLSKENNG